MSITQQYFLDAYRARRACEPVPPAPGANDWQVVREWRDAREFRAVVAGHAVCGRPRFALVRWLRRRQRATR